MQQRLQTFGVAPRKEHEQHTWLHARLPHLVVRHLAKDALQLHFRRCDTNTVASSLSLKQHARIASARTRKWTS
eukprot:1665469-Pleurochrysis_carterae.AAC.4